jgi:hypothetical protein
LFSQPLLKTRLQVILARHQTFLWLYNGAHERRRPRTSPRSASARLPPSASMRLLGSSILAPSSTAKEETRLPGHGVSGGLRPSACPLALLIPSA